MSTRHSAGSYPGAEHDGGWRRLVAPHDHRNPVPQPRYHLAVVGAGPAGLVAAMAAAGLGAKVALIERQAMGGDCLNVGCVPSKTLLEFTRRHRDGAEFSEAFTRLRRVRERLAAHDSVRRFTQAGIDVFLGPGRFTDARTLHVGGNRLLARRILIATGARPALPAVPGLAESDPLTNESVFDLVERPRRLGILGGGPTGCELAQAFARLGVEVHLFEPRERVLPMEHREAGAAVGAALTRDGVRLHLGSPVARIASENGFSTVHAGDSVTAVDRILVAAGRRANVEDLNLGVAGIQIREGLIAVDRRLRTTNPKVYAAGDVCSPRGATHNADAQARIVVQNALFAPTASTDGLIIPHCTYTEPEVARVGPAREELERGGTPVDLHRVELAGVDRAAIQGEDEGFVEVLTPRGSGVILGATIVASDAGEQIACLCFAMANGLGLRALGSAVLPYPTRGEYLRRLADGYNRTRLTPLARRLLGLWLGLTG